MERVNNQPFTVESVFLLTSLGLILGSLTGGYCASQISKRKKRLCSAIVGLLLGLFFLFRLRENNFHPGGIAITLLSLIILAGWIGGLMAGNKSI